MQLLPKDQIKIIVNDLDNTEIIAGIHSHIIDGHNIRCWEKYKVSDLPNDLIDSNDLKRCGINLVDGRAFGRTKIF
ncbi:MAG: hypothetical protein PHX78_10850 [bacterium]|nr:hypothetical protein [bacterium]